MIWEELEKARNTLYEVHKIVTEMDKEKQKGSPFLMLLEIYYSEVGETQTTKLEVK